MIQILQNMQPLITKLSQSFIDENCTDFQLSPYIVSKNTEKGLLVFTTLTSALLHLDGVYSANDLCEKAKRDDEFRKTLLLHRVLIPSGFDEQNFCEQLRIIILGERKRLLQGTIKKYTIFTTTACNARCYYCFEHGYAPVTMTEETALKTAEYIEAHADGEVTLIWFGGEPLVNTNAIDIITGYLARQGISYKSHIVTNAYLFTPELIQRAKEQWKLVEAQITLDGTRENYNRIKAYANGDTDAFSRVLGNIKVLAESGIHILLNLNLSRENEKDMYALLTELTPMIKENPERFSLRPSLLHQYGGAADEEEMQQKRVQMNEWLRVKGLIGEPVLPKMMQLNSCSADNYNTVIIQADGGLNCCSHIGESKPYGGVFEGEVDSSIIRWWAERRPSISECDGCALYPRCLRLEHCEAKKFNCTNLTRKEQLSDIVLAMETSYDHNINNDATNILSQL